MNALTTRGFANNEAGACPAFAAGTTTLSCAVTGTGARIQLGHYDPYADSITVSVAPADFVAEPQTATLTAPPH